MNRQDRAVDLAETRVGPAILVTGKIEGEGSLVVEGRIEGGVAIKGDLSIEPSGQVKSNVQARNIYVSGLLVGDAVAIEKVEVAPGGRMVGNVRSPRVHLQEGALFRGRVEMVDFEGEARPVDNGRRTHAQPTRSTSPVFVPARSSANRDAARAGLPEPRRDLNAHRDTPLPRPPVAPSAPRPAPPANLYTPPPLPRPAETEGPRKAIVIRKKSNDAG